MREQLSAAEETLRRNEWKNMQHAGINAGRMNQVKNTEIRCLWDTRIH